MIFGIDVSRYQPQMDWALLKSKGVEFAFIKATQGNYHVDPMMRTHLAGAKAAGMRTGLYHWDDPLETPASQAAWFLSKTAGLEFDFAVDDSEQQWADWQEWSSGCITQLLSPELISHSAQTIMSIWEQAGLKTILYTRKSFMESFSRPMLKWCGGKILWLAHYPYNTTRITTTWEEFKAKYLPSISGPDLPEGVNKWHFWQFTGDKFVLPGNAGAIDVNFYNGSIEQLQTLTGKTAVPPEPEPPEEPMPTVTGKSLGVSIAPDRTPFIDFDAMKAGGVTFIMAWAGAGLTGDPLVDGKPQYISPEVVDWVAWVCAEAARIDVPIAVHWENHPEHGTGDDANAAKQSQALEYLIKNKSINGIFASVNLEEDNGKPIDPVWVNNRLRSFVGLEQGLHPGVWTGPMLHSKLTDPKYAEYWSKLEVWAGVDGVVENTGPALCWIEEASTPQTLTWAQLPAAYPTHMPLKTPMDTKHKRPSRIYLWVWALGFKLPGFWKDANKTIPGSPWMVFFDGDEAAKDKFFFYTKHGGTITPPPPGDGQPGDDDQGNDQGNGQTGGTVNTSVIEAKLDTLHQDMVQTNGLLAKLAGHFKDIP
jgi:lysozyme